VGPVGRSTLGRLFNVLGATIDAYSGIDELPTYSDYPVSFDQYEKEGSTHMNQKVQFKSMGSKIIKIYKEEEKKAKKKFNTLKHKINSIKNIFTSLNKYLSQQKAFKR
jgi:F0F1-type ATP synthase beta subunit